jgi:hypothetical protein
MQRMSALCWIFLFLFYQSFVFAKPSLQDWDGKTPFLNEMHPDPKTLLALSQEDIEGISMDTLFHRAEFLEDNFRQYHCFNGLVWKGFFKKNTDPHPYCFDVGSNSAIFTGFYLAAAVYRYKVTQKEEDLNKILDSIRGLHILTHASGTPGVLVRSAFPIEKAHLWKIEGNEKPLYDGQNTVPDIFGNGENYPAMRFYARTTRDQLTGVLFGLAVAWTELFQKIQEPEAAHTEKIKKALEALSIITQSLYRRIRANAYVLRDHLGKTGTLANTVDGILRLQLLALTRRILMDERTEGFRPKPDLNTAKILKKKLKSIRKEYRRSFAYIFFKDTLGNTLYPLSNLHQYYAWNLRFTRFYSIFILETNKGRKYKLFKKIKNDLWESSLLFTGKSIQSHQNTYFTFLYQHMLMGNKKKYKTILEILHLKTSDSRNALENKYFQEALWSLKALALCPLRNWPSPLINQFVFPYQFVPVHLRKPSQHFIWQMTPFGNKAIGTKEENALLEATGVDFLLPYWFGRAKGFIAPPASSRLLKEVP